MYEKYITHVFSSGIILFTYETMLLRQNSKPWRVGRVIYQICNGNYERSQSIYAHIIEHKGTIPFSFDTGRSHDLLKISW